MGADAVAKRIREFLAERFPTTRGVGVDERLLMNGMVDSLGILDIVSFLEQEFEIKVTDEELLPENFQSINSLSAFVHSKTSSNSVPY